MSYTGKQPQFTDLSTTATITAGTGITATTGDVTISDGELNVVDAAGKTIISSSGSPVMFIRPATIGTDTYIGRNAGNDIQTDGFNVGIGENALNVIDAGSSLNSVCGATSAAQLTTGALNSILGANSAISLTTGNANCIIGSSSGNAYTGAESSNILISNNGVVAESNKIRIGTAGSGVGQQNACFIAGIFGVTVGGSGIPVNVDNAGQLGTVVSSLRFKENIKPITETNVLQLQPVSFNYKTDESKSRQYGLIAEEVNEYMPELVVYDDQKNPYSVRYHELPVILLAEIQKLIKRIEILENQ